MAVLVPAARLSRWLENFAARHGETVLGVDAGALTGAGADGSSFRASLPFSGLYAGPPNADTFVAACVPPAEWGVLLVRKGGFAVARLTGTVMPHPREGKELSVRRP